MLIKTLSELPEFRYAKHDPDNYKSRALEIAEEMLPSVCFNGERSNAQIHSLLKARQDNVELLAKKIQDAYNEGWQAGANYAASARIEITSPPGAYRDHAEEITAMQKESKS